MRLSGFCIGLLLMVQIQVGWSQEQSLVDSLQNVLQGTTPDQKILVLYKLGWQLKGTEPKKSLEYITQSLELALAAGDEVGEANAYNGLGALALVDGDYDKAQAYFTKSLTIKLRRKDSLGAATQYNNLAIIRSRRDNLSGSLEYYLKATKIRENAGNFSLLAANYLNIGVIYNKMGHYELSEKYFLKSLDLSMSLDQKKEQAKAYNGLGNVYRMKEDYARAIGYFLKSLDLKKNYNDRQGIGITYHNLGDLMLLTDSVDAALDYYLKAKAINESLHARGSLILSLEGEAMARLLLNQLDSAEKLALQAMVLANEIQEPHKIQNLNLTLSYIYAAKRKFELASTYRSNYLAMLQKSSNEALKKQIAEMQTQYETHKKEQENEILRQQKTAQEITLTYQQMIIGISVFGLAILFYLILLASRKSKKLKASNAMLNDQYQAIEQNNRQLKALMEENTLLMNIVAHDLRSPLNNIQGLLQIIEMEKKHNEAIDPYLHQIKDMATAGDRLIRDLLTANRPDPEVETTDLEKINLNECLEKLCADYRKPAADKQIGLKLALEAHYTIWGNKDAMRRIMENLLSNAMKFSDFGTEINIAARTTTQRTLEIAVMDQGPGIRSDELDQVFNKFTKLSNRPTNGESSTGLGLAIVKRLAEDMKFDIGVQSEVGQGTTFIVTVPESSCV